MMTQDWKRGRHHLIDFSFTGGAIPAQCAFTRASIKLAFNASGVLAEVAENVGAFEYDPATLALRGLLIEPQRQNILVHSNKIGDTANGWTKGPYATVTLNDAIAPDGTQTASKILFSRDDAGADVWQGQAATLGVRHTISVYLKAGTASQVQLLLTNASASTLGSVVATLSSTWTLFTVSALADSSGAMRLRLRAHSSGADKDFYAAFAQMETVGSVATSRIVTEASAVTRAADALSFTIPSGVSALRYVFDNDTTQDVSVSAGAYTVPTNLNRPHIKRILSL